MNPIAAGSDLLNRLPYRRTRGTPFGREAGKKHGVVQVVVDDRELTWRPALSGTGYGPLHIEPGPHPQSGESEQGTYLYNVGGSPAIGARYVYWREAPGWFLSTPIDVPAHGGSAEVVRGQSIDETLGRTVLGSIGARHALAGAIFCRDFLHRRWCFPIPDFEHSVILEPIVWRKGARAPLWASSPEVWGPEPARRRSVVIDRVHPEAARCPQGGSPDPTP
ncbi:MAG: hypothetical protein WB793_11420 [Candidatus Dormiibacterota bacterium]